MEYQLGEGPSVGVHGFGGGEGFLFPGGGGDVATASIPSWPLPSVNVISPAQFFTGANAIFSSPPFYGYGDAYSAWRASSAGLQFGYDGGITSPLHDKLFRGEGVASSTFAGLCAKLGKMTPQEIMDAKALAASKSHSEAERRRRERINGHLAKLRSLLPNTTKTDKASLLAEVIQHVKELKRQTSEIAEDCCSPLPTEADELTVGAAGGEDGRFVVRLTLCCEDRSDLLPDLIKALKALRLRTLKAEITTLGGRVKNVLLVTGEGEGEGEGYDSQSHCIVSIQEALRAVMDRRTTGDPTSPSGVKQQRRTNTTQFG